MNPAPSGAPSSPGLLSGIPQSPRLLPVVRPVLPTLESIEDDLREMLDTGILTNAGPFTDGLEQALADRLDLPNPVVVGNGTVAIMLALEALVPPGGEVVVPSFTFAATANAVTWAGYTPVFADIDLQTLTLDPASVERVIGPKTVAVHARASVRRPVRHRGTGNAGGRTQSPRALRFGAGGWYSLPAKAGWRIRCRRDVQPPIQRKVLPVGEGGVVCSRDTEAADRIRRTRNFGLGSAEAVNGLNGKITEFSALLGLRALDTLDEHLATADAQRTRSGEASTAYRGCTGSSCEKALRPMPRTWPLGSRRRRSA